MVCFNDSCNSSSEITDFASLVYAGITRHGGLPDEPQALRELGSIANAFGATCTQSVGGVPSDTSR